MGKPTYENLYMTKRVNETWTGKGTGTDRFKVAFRFPILSRNLRSPSICSLVREMTCSGVCVHFKGS